MEKEPKKPAKRAEKVKVDSSLLQEWPHHWTNVMDDRLDPPTTNHIIDTLDESNWEFKHPTRSIPVVDLVRLTLEEVKDYLLEEVLTFQGKSSRAQAFILECLDPSMYYQGDWEMEKELPIANPGEDVDIEGGPDDPFIIQLKFDGASVYTGYKTNNPEIYDSSSLEYLVSRALTKM